MDIKEKVKAKLLLKPQCTHIETAYMDDTIEDAVNDVKDFINMMIDEELPEALVTPITDLCVIRLNLTGAEGITSSSKAGTSETYMDDIPKSIRRKLMKYRSLP
ncbi:hypothetical protein DWX45_16460 [Erysipelotrichaceae bacterium AF19-24AC]|mgnify:CR=1 FL=1|jgi:hypothetical protein|nr:hypothetical protein DWX45_16460 [Erysipelotrichaceae bacterium AF19-24AC]